MRKGKDKDKGKGNHKSRTRHEDKELTNDSHLAFVAAHEVIKDGKEHHRVNLQGKGKGG
jgi:hypothetical protein